MSVLAFTPHSRERVLDWMFNRPSNLEMAKVEAVLDTSDGEIIVSDYDQHEVIASSRLVFRFTRPHADESKPLLVYGARVHSKLFESDVNNPFSTPISVCPGETLTVTVTLA